MISMFYYNLDGYSRINKNTNTSLFTYSDRIEEPLMVSLTV